MMFCLSASARVSDALNVTNLNVDKADSVCILECDTLRHKTATTKEKQTTFLPYITLGALFQDESWAEEWLQARTQSGLGANSYPLCAPNYSGGWMPRRISTGEISLWLRDILVSQGLELESVQRLTSHSLKTTILSWCAKFGMDTPTRRIVGHHVDPESRSALTYSRGALIAAHIKIYDMTRVILSGGFNPDLTRAQRLLHHVLQSNLSEVNPSAEADNDAKELVVDTSSSEDDIHQVCTADDDARVMWDLITPDNSIPHLDNSGGTLVQHVVSGIVHIKHPSLHDTLKCGRIITDNYRPYHRVDTITWPSCGQCGQA